MAKGQTPLTTDIPRVDPACAQGGTVETHSLDLTTVEASIRYQIYLPPCYEENSTWHYPVIFLLHTAGGNCLDWNRHGAAETADRLIRDGAVPPFILVTPAFFRLDDKCLVLATDFAPLIDSHFRTRSHPRYRGWGASSGGHLAACMAFQFPDQFGSVGVFGGGIFSEHTPDFLRWIDATHPQDRPRVLIDAGQQDDMMPFANLLTHTLSRREEVQ